MGKEESIKRGKKTRFMETTSCMWTCKKISNIKRDLKSLKNQKVRKLQRKIK
jgi:hypothetical protein